MSETKSLGDYFFKGENQNGSLWRNYCKACVIHHLQTSGAPESAITTRGPAFDAACIATGSIVANQAGCERTSFSKTKIEQSDHRNRLGLAKLEKQTRIASQIRSEHQQQGLYKPRKVRKNHESTANLLSVPRYRDLLDDQDHEDPSEHGRALISSAEGWRTQMAKWIGDAREAQRLDDEADAETIETPVAPRRKSAWGGLLPGTSINILRATQ
ncbi:hypothetical protein B0H13DRAFT_2340465 [Mycena leptocephala]|nr:hypothetical protein B0H13DRAFT_2340465 [Mycena leptocephala]